MKNRTIEKLNRISIRGRFSIGLSLLVEALNRADQNFTTFNEVVLLELGKFTSSDKLDEWHSVVERLLPEYIINLPHDKVSDILSFEKYHLLKEEYNKMDAKLINLVENVAWIGIVAVYNNRVDSIRESLFYLQEVIRDFQSEKQVEEAIDRFVEFSIDIDGGWGAKFL